MSKPDRSRVIRLAEAQAGIPGPAGEHSVSLLRRGTLNVVGPEKERKSNAGGGYSSK